MNIKSSIFVMMFFMTTFAIADNEIYIDQVGAGADIDIKQDGSGNVMGGDAGQIAAGAPSKFVLDGLNLNFNAQMIGSSNKLYGSLFGDDINFDLDIDGSSNELNFDNDKDDVYGADNGDYVIDITGGNNDLDLDVASLDAADNLDLDLILDGDFNVGDINIDASSLTFNLDVTGDNNNLLYNAEGYDGHYFKMTGVGNYWDIEVNQTSTLQSDSLEVEFSGSGTSTTDATICITQSDSGTATTCP